MAQIETLNPQTVSARIGVTAPFNQRAPQKRCRRFCRSTPHPTGPDTDTVITQYRSFLAKLVEHGVDLTMLRLFATGGRGFHIEVPWECFIPKPPKNGMQRLPAIYKEIAFELFVDTLDMRVYSGRKGRMWRTPNVVRENGKYKVPVTVDESLSMTATDYQLLCSTPREAPSITPPLLCQKLAVLYAKASGKIESAAKRKKGAKKDFELLARFKGQFPPSLAKILAGEGTAENVGFHQIALQVAITANALVFAL